MIAHRIPAKYPAAKDTPSCSVLLQSDFGFGTTLVYNACTMFSNAAATHTGKCVGHALHFLHVPT